MIKNVLFDLDGTLLPMDFDTFLHGYFGLLCKSFAPLGYVPDELSKAVLKATSAVVANSSVRTNEEVFWSSLPDGIGDRCRRDREKFDEFYKTDFHLAKKFCGYTPCAKETVEFVKSKGMNPILATNPVFPAAATNLRIKWAGLCADDFIYISTYENSTRCKPNSEYYTEIANKLSLNPEECLMVGNDAEEDTSASKAGMQVFLLTNNLINRNNCDINRYPHGGFDELKNYISQL